ncbi:MAG: nucleoside hydrolase [Bacillales bacterium]|jgi:inosine-uridine nucleoside N-ribohydrolase|nr:nucleoside hydrolase [Bacillales bacterium]
MNINNIIIDTDIGDDIDDIWAVVYALINPQFKVRAISVTSGNVDYKAKLVAKILKELNQTDVLIIKGKAILNGCNAQQRWLNDFTDYEGEITNEYNLAYQTLFNKYNDITIFELGPINDLANFIKSFNNKEKINLIMMGGAYKKGYLGEDKPEAEANLIYSYSAFNELIKSIKITLLPLDVCRSLIINKELYQELLKSKKKNIKLLLDNYHIWQSDYLGGAKKFNLLESTSVLFDIVVPLYYLYGNLFKVENLKIKSNEKGCLIEGEKEIKIATLVNENELMNRYVADLLRY